MAHYLQSENVQHKDWFRSLCGSHLWTYITNKVRFNIAKNVVAAIKSDIFYGLDLTDICSITFMYLSI